MGRYTTVQAYADNNPSMRTVGYEQTAAAAVAKKNSANNPTKLSSATKPPSVHTEKVDNPYGSTAGAGSGEFHTYRHSRARENARLAELDRVEAVNDADAKWTEKLEVWKVDDETKAAKRRRKRERAKEAKRRKKIMKMNGVDVGSEEREDAGDGEEEFDYTPVYATTGDQKGEGEDKQVGAEEELGGAKDVRVMADDQNSSGNISRRKEGPGDSKVQSTVVVSAFSNDGSFIEIMKRQMASQTATGD